VSSTWYETCTQNGILWQTGSFSLPAGTTSFDPPHRVADHVYQKASLLALPTTLETLGHPSAKVLLPALCPPPTALGVGGSALGSQQLPFHAAPSTTRKATEHVFEMTFDSQMNFRPSHPRRRRDKTDVNTRRKVRGGCGVHPKHKASKRAVCHYLVLPKNHTETDLEHFQCDCEQPTKEAPSVARVPDADLPQPTVDRGNHPLASAKVVFEDICLN
jgi:hypothetical protein